MRPSTVKVIMMIAVAIGCQGCNRNHGKLTITAGGGVSEAGPRARAVKIGADPIGQTLTFNIKVKSGPNIDCYVVPSQYVQGEDDKLDLKDKDIWKSKAIGKQLNSNAINFKATMSNNVEYKIVVMQTESSKTESTFDIRVTNY